MSEPDGKKWVTAIIMLIILFVTLGVILALLIPTSKGTFVNKFSATTVSVPGQTSTMTKFAGATLYPYSGNWDFDAANQTPDQCVATCLSDPTCRGFYHHNDLSNLTTQGACYFYRNNNVQETVGFNVELSTFFLDTALVFGDQLPGSSTDTYIKEDQAFKMFRSLFAKPAVVSA